MSISSYTVPSIETIEKLARAFEVLTYQIFYEGDEKPPVKVADPERGWGSIGKDAKTLARFRRLLRRTNDADRKVLMFMATKMAARKTNRKKLK